MTFFVYEYWRPDTNQPFYVGKGSHKRVYEKWARTKRFRAILACLKELGLDPIVKKVYRTEDETKALAHEAKRIDYWTVKGVRLVNWSMASQSVVMTLRRKEPSFMAALSAAEAKRTQAIKKSYENPALRAKVGEAVHKARASSNERNRMREATKRAFSDPDVRRRHRAAVIAWWAKRKQTEVLYAPDESGRRPRTQR